MILNGRKSKYFREEVECYGGSEPWLEQLCPCHGNIPRSKDLTRFLEITGVLYYNENYTSFMKSFPTKLPTVVRMFGTSGTRNLCEEFDCLLSGEIFYIKCDVNVCQAVVR